MAAISVPWYVGRPCGGGWLCIRGRAHEQGVLEEGSDYLRRVWLGVVGWGGAAALGLRGVARLPWSQLPAMYPPPPPPIAAGGVHPCVQAAGMKRDYDFLFKLVLIGDSGVGKSCLLLRFAVCVCMCDLPLGGSCLVHFPPC